ncbi:hypothetical protein chiPu_0033647, partial [Chiloscyllium punctatum]|nr:hypothetical protein [Chiloscyllium punctatum]
MILASGLQLRGYVRDPGFKSRTSPHFLHCLVQKTANQFSQKAASFNEIRLPEFGMGQ